MDKTLEILLGGLAGGWKGAMFTELFGVHAGNNKELNDQFSKRMCRTVDDWEFRHFHYFRGL